jgi:hypothetical protein
MLRSKAMLFSLILSWSALIFERVASSEPTPARSYCAMARSSRNRSCAGTDFASIAFSRA